MNRELSMTDKSLALKKLFNFLLESVSEGGYWKDYDESWGPITTAITTELLLNAGINLNDKWYINRGHYIPITLTKSIQYLNEQIREDGSFGSDFWDALRLGKIIVSHELKTHFSRFEKLHNYISTTIEGDKIFDLKSQWNGPGCYACAVDYLDIVKLDESCEKTIQKLLSYQQKDGFWAGPPNKEGIPTFPVWHTAQVILTLRRKNENHYKSEIDRAVNWLINVQETEGSWQAAMHFEIYFTAYAIWCLNGLQHQEKINDATAFLYSKIANDGKCIDLGGTLMCAIAFWELFKNDAEKNMSFIEYLLASKASDVTNQLENEVNVLNTACKAKDNEIQEFKNKYKDADIVISKKTLLIIVLVSLFITVLGTVVGIYGLKLAVDAVSKTPFSHEEDFRQSNKPQEEINKNNIPPNKFDSLDIKSKSNDKK